MNLENYRETASALRGEWNENIEKYRKSDVIFQIVDTDGNPVPNAAVSVRQNTHEFDFGCNCLKIGQMGADEKTYETELTRLFNLVTTTTCLAEYEPTPGEWRFAEGSREIFRRPPIDRIVRFAKENGLRLKGQPLLAGSWFPKWAAEYSDEKVKEVYEDFFTRFAERYQGDFHIVDVVNEAFCHTKFPLYEESCQYVDWAFEVASKVFPKSVITELNEATYQAMSDRYFALAKRLIDKQVGLKSLGFQFHDWRRDTLKTDSKLAIPTLYQWYQKFSTLNIPLYITEITIPSLYTDMSREEGEDLQAEKLANLYRMWFSIPNMHGIIYWNIDDGIQWKTEGNALGCLLDTNLHEKPSYYQLYSLIHREWKTSAILQSDENGSASLRGFKGGYTGTVTVNEHTVPFAFDIADKNEPVRVTIV